MLQRSRQAGTLHSQAANGAQPHSLLRLRMSLASQLLAHKRAQKHTTSVVSCHAYHLRLDRYSSKGKSLA
jgi:hypothetical protein